MKKLLVLFFLFSGIICFGQNLEISKAALELTKDGVVYDPTYFSIPYPNGDMFQKEKEFVQM